MCVGFWVFKYNYNEFFYLMSFELEIQGEFSLGYIFLLRVTDGYRD